MVFGLSVLNRVYNFMQVCPKWGSELVLNRVWSVRLPSLNMAYTVFNNPRLTRLGTFPSVSNTLKLCKTRECVFCHLS